jgi:fatty acid desaturase
MSSAAPSPRSRRDPYQPFRSSTLAPERVRELSRLRPRKAMADAAIAWTWIVAAWILAAYADTWWAVAAAIPVIGNRYYGLYILGHDGLHRRLFDDFATNDLVCDLFILAPIGSITRINNRNHLQHHQNLANETDPDRHKHGCFNKVTRLELAGYLTAVTSALRSVRNVLVGSSAGTEPTEGSSRTDGYRLRDIAILFTVQGALCLTLSLLFGWWGYLLLWWVPVFLFTFLPDNLRSFVEHSHAEADERADEHRLITHLPHPIERALLSPMNMNYHAAHHLWPSIPYYNLPAADSELRAVCSTDALAWRRSYLGYLWSFARKQPLEECRKAPTRV